jgi:hypothetical protein
LHQLKNENMLFDTSQEWIMAKQNSVTIRNLEAAFDDARLWHRAAGSCGAPAITGSAWYGHGNQTAADAHLTRLLSSLYELCGDDRQ